ncbi:MAG: cation:proton antiporter [Planctomycetia bacterium]|nr:cation:proton antiporter [Planctomycetia bacterium]
MSEVWIHVTTVFQQVDNWLLIGAALLLGHFGGKLVARCRLPAVVGYLLVGVALGPSLLNIISFETSKELGLVADLGLGIIGFMIGTEISKALFKRMGKQLGVIIFGQSLACFVLVLLGVWLLGGDSISGGAVGIAAALIFASMAPASAPAGTVAVVQEYRAKGPFTSLILAVVGLNDGTAIIIYVFAAAAAKVLLGINGTGFGDLIAKPVVEIVGAIAVGAVVGALLTAVVSRTKSRAEVFILTLGAIIITTGLANALHLSLILANLAVGVLVVNISTREAERTYAAAAQVTPPIFVLFFVLAGAHLDFATFGKISLIVPVYIVCRILGMIGGSYLGALVSKADDTVKHWLGLGILSQAGVAIGLSLLVMKEFGTDGPFGDVPLLVINTIAVTTIFFEILGPITTKLALSKAGEIGGAEPAGQNLS